MEKYLTGVSLLMLMAILPLEAGQEIKVDLGKNFVLNDGGNENFYCWEWIENK